MYVQNNVARSPLNGGKSGASCDFPIKQKGVYLARPLPFLRTFQSEMPFAVRRIEKRASGVGIMQMMIRIGAESPGAKIVCTCNHV